MTGPESIEDDDARILAATDDAQRWIAQALVDTHGGQKEGFVG